MKLVRCDLCGKEIDREKGNKVTIEHALRLFFTKPEFEMDLCSSCTKELEGKVRENRLAADKENEQEEKDNE